MRQIKFRGKRLDNGEWKYGEFAIIDDKPAIVFGPVDFIDGVELQCLDWAWVEPDTVGQFTGLYDKNGSPIYEVDIVNIHDSHETCGIVEYRDNIASFVLCREKVKNKHKGDGTDYQLYAGRQKRYEIIGNKYDNPELIKSDKL